MRPRGLYVVDSGEMYNDSFAINAKLSTVHNCLTDKLIEKAKEIAKENQLVEFGIIYVDVYDFRHLLYIRE